MLAKLYPYAELTERDLSVSSLRRLRILTGILLFLSPCIAIAQQMPIGDELRRLIIIGVSSGIVISCVLMLFNRLSHIIMFPDKYLDEWEIRMKKDAESFAYRFFAFLVIPLFILSSMIYGGPESEEILFSTEDFYLYSLLFVLPMCILPIAHIAWTQKPLQE